VTPNDESPPDYRGTFAVQAADYRGDLVERVTGIEPALSAWEPTIVHSRNHSICNMFRSSRTLGVELPWN
jgi:hypothetical protein